MSKKKKDLRLVLLLIFTAIVGLIHLLVNGNKELLAAYIGFAVVGMISIYFAYSLSRFKNRRENYWKEKNPGDGEPTDILIVMVKFGGWVMFVIAMIFALIPKA